MNLYKITATTNMGKQLKQFFNASTEQDARDSFREAHEGELYIISNVEYIREYHHITKQQERDALETIKEMVYVNLGPQSSLAFAFEGAFEDAEDNINNDTAFSYKRRYEQAVKAQKDADSIRQKMEDQIEWLEDRKEDLEHTITRLQEKTAPSISISPADLQYVISAEAVSCKDCKDQMKDAAERIVRYADNPTSEQFADAVREHRDLAGTIEVKKERLKRLQKVLDAMFDDPADAPTTDTP